MGCKSSEDGSSECVATKLYKSLLVEVHLSIVQNKNSTDKKHLDMTRA